ncbi:SpoIIE family protein phosphatase [Ruminococcaceae bacterium OttesenSCG-928-I18]|nr:SpoIIE family protein phosphatase [Ruminococcaceae bacterium OttesenSCG-928-I18]
MRKKLTRLVVMVMLFVLVGTGVTALVGMLNMRKNVEKSIEETGEITLRESTQLMHTQSVNMLREIAKEKAANVEGTLLTLGSITGVVKEEMNLLYERPPEEETGVPEETAEAGEVRLTLAQGIPQEGLAGEIAQTKRAAELIDELSELSQVLSVLQFSSESGFTYVAADGQNDSREAQDARETRWYQAAKEAGHMVATEQAAPAGDMLVFSAPVYDGQGAFRGVVAAGAPMEAIWEGILDTEEESVSVLIIDKKGRVIQCSSGQEEEWEKALFGEGGQHAAPAEEPAEGQSGLALIEFEGQEVYLAYEPLQAVSWQVATVVPAERLTFGQATLRQLVAETTASSVRQINHHLVLILSALGLILLVCLVFALLYAKRASTRLVAPLLRLEEKAREIGKGDFETRLDIQTGDEVEDLARSINKMADSLQSYMRQVTASAAERERVLTELKIAKEIQTSMLPRLQPVFSNGQEVSLYAEMEPARQVGGDFYDFFFTGEGKLAVVIADVSGKGVPAALFMANAKAVLHNALLQGLAPGAAAEETNRQLCVNNQTNMFVTAFVGLLDTKTGRFTYVNAGHNPPLWAGEQKEYRWLPLPKGLILGAMEESEYPQKTLAFSPGDRLFLYTDGVTEAEDREARLFGEEALQRTLNETAARKETLEETCKTVMGKLNEHGKGTEQSDDITMLALQWRGKREETEP